MKFSLCLAMLIICSQAAFADWKEFRGPTGQGEAPASKLPINWSATDNVLWKSKVDGLAWSSPVILGDKVFLTTAVETESEGHDLNLVCLNVNSGELLWEKTIIQQRSKAKVHKRTATPAQHRSFKMIAFTFTSDHTELHVLRWTAK